MNAKTRPLLPVALGEGAASMCRQEPQGLPTKSAKPCRYLQQCQAPLLSARISVKMQTTCGELVNLN
jgi:hypothetical protein